MISALHGVSFKRFHVIWHAFQSSKASISGLVPSHQAFRYLSDGNQSVLPKGAFTSLYRSRHTVVTDVPSNTASPGARSFAHARGQTEGQAFPQIATAVRNWLLWLLVVFSFVAAGVFIGLRLHKSSRISSASLSVGLSSREVIRLQKPDNYQPVIEKPITDEDASLSPNRQCICCQDDAHDDEKMPLHKERHSDLHQEPASVDGLHASHEPRHSDLLRELGNPISADIDALHALEDPSQHRRPSMMTQHGSSSVVAAPKAASSQKSRCSRCFRSPCSCCRCKSGCSCFRKPAVLETPPDSRDVVPR